LQDSLNQTFSTPVTTTKRTTIPTESLPTKDKKSENIFRATTTLHSAELIKAILLKAKFIMADCTETQFIESNLNKSNFYDANLTGANFTQADLKGASFRKANLNGTSFIESDIKFADFREAKNLDTSQITQAKNWEWAFYDIDMIRSLGLTSKQLKDNIIFSIQFHHPDELHMEMVPERLVESIALLEKEEIDKLLNYYQSLF